MRQRAAHALQRAGLLGAAARAHELLTAARWYTRRWRARQYRTSLPDGLPVPPMRLIIRVAGWGDLGWFFESGQRGAECIRGVLEKNGIAFAGLRTILDFGCGCGRVLRHWAGVRTATVYGSDYNAALIRWCRRHLTFARFETNDLAPPLRFGDATFDLIYAFSVFTHLPEALQIQWMAELRRVLRPGGYLIISTHGERYVRALSPEQRAAFAAGRLVVQYAAAAGTNVCGAYDPPAYVRAHLARGFDVIDYVPEGAQGNPSQDLYLMQKQRLPSPERR